MELINRIFFLMETNSINAATLTREVPLTNGLITQWKQGKQKPSLEAVIKIAEYFNVSTDYLLGLTEVKNYPKHSEENESYTLEEFMNSEGITDKDQINSVKTILDMMKKQENNSNLETSSEFLVKELKKN